MQDLDKLLEEKTEEKYSKYIEDFSSTIDKARDKYYAFNSFKKKAANEHAYFTIQHEHFDDVMEQLEARYKLGDSFKDSIIHLHKYFDEVGLIRSIAEEKKMNIPDDILENLSFFQPFIELKKLDNQKLAAKKGQKEPETYSNWKTFSDIELLDIYAQHKAFNMFMEYLEENKLINPSEIKEDFIVSKNKEHTTARQVAAMLFIFKCLNVKSGHIRPKAEFIHFLTGKSFDNISKRISNPYNITDDAFKKDMRYVKDYFKNLGLDNIVALMNKEMDS